MQMNDPIDAVTQKIKYRRRPAQEGELPERDMVASVVGMEGCRATVLLNLAELAERATSSRALSGWVGRQVNTREVAIALCDRLISIGNREQVSSLLLLGTP